MYEVDEEVKQKVYQEFGRTKECIEEDVQTIKDWFKTQPHLPEIMGDVEIRNFLTLNKFSIEKTKKKIDLYYTFQSLIPQLFVGCNPEKEHLKKFYNTAYLFNFPQPLNGIYRIIYLKFKTKNCLDVVTLSKAWFANFEMRLHEDFMVSDIFIFDWNTVTLNDTKNFISITLANILQVYQKVYSFRAKDIYFINAPPYINTFMAVVKTLISVKIYNRIQVHSDDLVLAQILPKEMLPSDYGGEGLSLEEYNEMMLNILRKYKDRFDFLDTLKVNESLRPEKLNNDEILGYYGNFKQIQFD